MKNTIQLFIDSEKKVKGYPITSPDRVIDDKGESIKKRLQNNVKFDIIGDGEEVPEIDGGYDDSELVEKIDNITERMAETILGNSVNVENFTGSDIEKLQKAFDYALENNKSVEISKSYNITGSSIRINKNFEPDHERDSFTIFGGGEIIKNDSGYFFKSIDLSQDIFVNDLKFRSVSGVGGALFKQNEFIRLSLNNCFIKNVDGVYVGDSNGQSLRINKCTIIGGAGYAIDISNLYDSTITNCLIENREGFFKQHGETYDKIGVASVTISNNCIENLSGIAISISNAWGLRISNNYFEKNLGGHIVFGADSITDSVLISGNIHVGTKESGVNCFTKWGKTLRSCISINNRIMENFPVNDVSNVADGFYLVEIENEVSNINKNTVVNHLVSIRSTNDGEIIKRNGYITNLMNKKLFRLSEGVIDYEIPFSVPISEEDVISVQFFSDPSMSITMETYYLTGNTVKVRLKNPTSTNPEVQIKVTILQLKAQ